MKDTEFECIKHGWRSTYQVCPFCMIMVLEEDKAKADKMGVWVMNHFEEVSNLKKTIDDLEEVKEKYLTLDKSYNILERQLAEARAEIERMNSIDYYACAMCPDIKEARQEAAIECLEIILNRKGYNQFAISDIKIKFGLEGEGCAT